VLSLSTIDPGLVVGEEVTIVWGEPGGGTRKGSTERPHRQIEVRATVGPAPIPGKSATITQKAGAALPPRIQPRIVVCRPAWDGFGFVRLR
jgi:hypothetical protein